MNKKYFFTMDISLKKIMKITGLIDEFAWSLIYDGFFICDEKDEWLIITTNSYDGWKTTIPKNIVEWGS